VYIGLFYESLLACVEVSFAMNSLFWRIKVSFCGAQFSLDMFFGLSWCM